MATSGTMETRGKRKKECDLVQQRMKQRRLSDDIREKEKEYSIQYRKGLKIEKERLETELERWKEKYCKLKKNLQAKRKMIKQCLFHQLNLNKHCLTLTMKK